MLSREAFAAGMALLALAYAREVTGEQSDLYYTMLRDLDDATFERCVRAVIREERFFPTVAVLRASAGDRTAVLEADRIYSLILSAYEDGIPVSSREIAEKLGEAAAYAFLEAGGQSAFKYADPRGEGFRHRAFLAAYREGAPSRDGLQTGQRAITP